MRHMQRQEDLFTLTNTLRPRWREVHGIALRYIFENLLPPQGLLQNSIANGPESRWCRMIRSMKSIMLVCKSWHTAAYPLLYRDIVLRRVGQVAAFARTLRSSPGTFAYYVRSVTITCGIPDSWKRVTGQSLAYIAQQCPNLTSLSFRAVFVDRDPEAHTPLQVLHTGLTPLTVPNNITHLGLFDERQFSKEYKPPFSSLTPLLSWCAHLISLSISASSLPLPGDDLVFQFSQLETLSIWSYRESGDNVENLPLSWDMPKLSALRLKPAVCFNQTSGARLASFCRKYAHTLTHLDFGGDRDFALSLETLDQQSTAASLCPNLRHLVLRVSECHTYSLEEVWYRMKQS
ncbi:uncharacterized protein PHACADRAFT_206600 [Phanerochaete carnosa HHB-10118-sp]|uniref:F-box domain-containing protein n=1 Tax=Phanerochaete carnosa (strain HHB-10118-sp) TaxID=650164 RepID=K5V510_PHACS|nr:uncharacterized protein PHACADRAFT_206600 [Phanerochaete carnosa HHB-10118-sp]EKM57721.1 hypothetical protein PHACADRAFT_206600 [Phanerochaete carnosa HHB-10118-sp]